MESRVGVSVTAVLLIYMTYMLSDKDVSDNLITTMYNQGSGLPSLIPLGASLS